MPGNQQKPEALDMDADMSPSCRLRDLSRGGSLDSRSSSSRSRSLTLDDESLKHLTHEEKDVILFFEETLDSLGYDFDEPALCDSGIHCHSPQSLEESPSSHSEPEDVIDLVQPGPASGEAESLPDVPPVAGAPSVTKQDAPALECGKQAAENSLPPPDSRDPEVFPLPLSLPVPAPSSPRKELMSPSPPAEHPKLPRSVPTPLVIAQKISEKLGNEALSPTSPSKEGRPGEWRTPASIASRNGDHLGGVWHRHTAQPAPKVHRFPSNISVTNSAGKDFNKTISKAAVNVQERKAQVLANINGMSFFAAGDTSSEERCQKAEEAQRGGSVDGARAQGRVGPAGEPGAPRVGGLARAQQSRAVQTEQPPALANGFQSVHEALRSEPSAFVPTSKTIAFRPEPAVASKLARQNASRSLYEPRLDGNQDARRHTGSLPRAAGFRPQGITVQFSGRGSTEEARREALRKLGLLKENL